MRLRFSPVAERISDCSRCRIGSTFLLTVKCPAHTVEGRMNSSQFLRWLRQHGCRVEATKGKGGHVKVVRGTQVSYVPTHGGARELGTCT